MDAQILKIGVTGTRSGCTKAQRGAIIGFLSNLTHKYQCELHHGDCIGVDAEVATIAHELNIILVCHPPEKTDLRAYVTSDVYRTETSYFARNRNIVNETDFLIVVPFQTTPQTFGGTWYTYDYAIKKKKPTRIFYPEDNSCM